MKEIKLDCRMKEIKLDLCKIFIKKVFEKMKCKGIETNCFFKMASEVGLYEQNTYGSEMGKALEELCSVKSTQNDDGTFAYNVFVLNEEGGNDD
jgi:hypothetical protein